MSLPGVNGSVSKELCTVDDLLRDRAKSKDPPPFLAYPRATQVSDDYEILSTADVDRLVDGAAKFLVEHGFSPVKEETVISIVGVSDLDYIITILGFCRLGYTILLLSPRLGIQAYVSLMNETESRTLFYTSDLQDIAEKIQSAMGGRLMAVLTRQDYDHVIDSRFFFTNDIREPSGSARKVFILHSSGSTQMPRPMHFTHKRLLAACAPALGYKAFLTVPLFHTHGLCVFFQTLYSRATVYLFNGNIPQTCDNLVRAIKIAQPEIVYTVPYILKLLAENEDGIHALKRCKLVSYAGSRCPDDLGDRLTNEGVRLGSVFGSTEIAMVFSSLSRPEHDTAWNYLRPVAHAAQYIFMKAIEDHSYELVILDGFRAKMVSNSNDPLNSYHSGDLFEPHPTLSEAWKFIGRKDDRITMINGEKVLPVPIEDTVRQSPLVREAVVFGNDRPACGLLVFRATSSDYLADERLLDEIWPYIAKANSRAEAFAQLSRDFTTIMPSNVDYPSTDKGSIRRAKVYDEFASIIDGVYSSAEEKTAGSLALTVSELEEWLQQKIGEQLGVHVRSFNEDLFTLGIDSLKAIHLRGIILNDLDIGQSSSGVGSMFVLEQRDIASLARALYNRRIGSEDVKSDPRSQLEEVVQEYSKFPTRHSTNLESPAEKNKVVLLTGSTGGLGQHVLRGLLANPTVRQIWCHVRATSVDKAIIRLKDRLAAHEKTLPHDSWSRIIVFTGTLESQNIGLTTSQYQELKSKLTHIIHAAYPVNFILPFESFVPHIIATHALLSLALSSTSSNPAKFIFCSSISVAASYSGPQCLVPSDFIPIRSKIPSTGYAKSKLVCENIISNAIATSQANALVIRIGQLIPSLHPSSSPLWNPSEAIPLLIRSALATGRLPNRTGIGGDICSWLPIDTAAQAILQLGGIKDGDESSHPDLIEHRGIYNLLHPHPLSWQQDVLPALRSAGLKFEVTDFDAWLMALRASDPDAEKNPSIKLLAYWEEQANEIRTHEDGDGTESVGGGFDTSSAERDSAVVRDAPNLVQEGDIGAFVKEWKRVWS